MDIDTFLQLKPAWAYEPCLYVVKQMFPGNNAHRCAAAGTQLHKDASTRESKKTLVNQIEHLCDVVLKKSKPKVSGNDGLQSLKIFAAIIKSSKTGKKIKL